MLRLENEFFRWDPARFKIDVRCMDDEHQILIAFMNHFERLCREQAARNELKLAMDKFVGFAKIHFQDEEAYMHKLGYPELGDHRSAHERLLKRLTEFSHIVESGAGILPTSFFDFLRNWLEDHIDREDRAYANYARIREAATKTR